MKTRAKYISVVLSVMMLFGLLSGCGARNTGSKASPYQVIMTFPNPFSLPNDWQAVQDAVSKITLKKIGATVKFVAIPAGSWDQRIPLIAAGQQKVDIMFVSPDYGFMNQVAQNELLPLGSLLNKYGPTIKKTLGDFLIVGKVNDKLYAVPTYENYAMQQSIVMRKDLLAKYHIDISKVKTPADLTAVFRAIKADDPGIIPLVPFTNKTVAASIGFDDDPLGHNIGVLPNYDNNLKVVDLYETPEYAHMVNLIRQWYNKGYVWADAATSTENPQDLVKSGRAFAALQPYMPGTGNMAEQMWGHPMATIAFGQRGVVTTSNVSINMWAISSSSRNPEKAMQFLNLMYSNKDILNLIDYGIEGKDYVKVSADFVTTPPGVSLVNAYPHWGFLFGDEYISYLQKGQPANFYTLARQFTNNATKSKALGFTFDISPVKTQYAAVMNVVDQYAPGLEDGSSDPASVLPKFIAKLKAAGIDQIIAQKQKQLDQWAKLNKISLSE